MGVSPETLSIYKKAIEAADKFDYFVCTVAGAIFAYSAQHYSPRRLDFDWPLLEPISLLLLALAFYFGLKRIEASRTVTQINHGLVDSEDKAKQLAEWLISPNPPRDLAGQVCDRQKVQAEHQMFLDYAKQWDAKLPAALLRARAFHKRRDVFLICGLLQYS